MNLDIIQECQIQLLSDDESLALGQNQSSTLVSQLHALQELGRDVIRLVLGSTNVDLSAVVGRWVMVRMMLLELIAVLWEMRRISVVRIIVSVAPLHVWSGDGQSRQESQERTDGGEIEQHDCDDCDILRLRINKRAQATEKKA